MKYLNITINCTLRESTSSKYRVVQAKKYKYNHTSRNSNQSKNIPGITPTSICRCTTKGRESLDRTCLWKQQAWAGRGKWIQLWNLLQEYVLNTFYAEGRLKNESLNKEIKKITQLKSKKTRQISLYFRLPLRIVLEIFIYFL